MNRYLFIERARGEFYVGLRVLGKDCFDGDLDGVICGRVSDGRWNEVGEWNVRWSPSGIVTRCNEENLEPYE